MWRYAAIFKLCSTLSKRYADIRRYSDDALSKRYADIRRGYSTLQMLLDATQTMFGASLRHCDSMIGKIIVRGEDRNTTIKRMRLALAETVVSGIKTNIALQQMIMQDQGFVAGGKNIHYLEKRLEKDK